MQVMRLDGHSAVLIVVPKGRTGFGLAIKMRFKESHALVLYQNRVILIRTKAGLTGRKQSLAFFT
jgi:hypothetical protein